jgi:hypothetical protein
VKPVRREPVKPKIPVAEKTPRQKRQAEKKPAPAPLPEEDKRFGISKLCCSFLGLFIDSLTTVVNSVVEWIRDMLVRIRILGNLSLSNGFGGGSETLVKSHKEVTIQ